MSVRQDKATSDKHAKILRELVKQPENKLCADCKRNDARWASWNLGCFICIRCSGIHRSMGTHISKVKSVDLDMWTPEQMACVHKWGNRRANLYWEAHLKPGHQPPDHKMDSFIRSKYESRRWAMEGPPPAEPSTLESNTPAESSTAESSTAAVPVSIAPISPPHSPPITSSFPAPVVTTTIPVAASRAQHQLLSAQHKRIPSIPRSTAAAPTAIAAAPVGGKVQTATTASTAQNDLFTLDFSPVPTPAATAAPKKDVKNDILSLFAQAPTATTQSATSPASTSLWGTAKPNPSLFSAPQAASAPSPSMMGTSGVGLWGAGTGWSQLPTASAPAPNAFGSFGVPSVPSAMSGANIWGNPVPAASAPPAANPLFATQNVWGNPPPAQPAHGANVDLFSSFGTSTPSAPAAKKDDAFGDIWSSFK